MFFWGHKSGSSAFDGVLRPKIFRGRHFWGYPSKKLEILVKMILWARPVASKLSERRPRKMGKNVFFLILANNSNAKFFKRYPGMPYESWRLAGSENVVVFVATIF